MNILILAALSLFPLLGLFLLGRGAREVWRGMASTHWPQTNGVVLASEVSENTATYVRTHTTSTTYSSKVTVGYKVDGKEYTTSILLNYLKHLMCASSRVGINLQERVRRAFSWLNETDWGYRQDVPKEAPCTPTTKASSQQSSSFSSSHCF